VQLGFADDARGLVDQQREQIERLRRQMNLVAIASERPPARIEDERSEPRVHSESLEFPRNLPSRAPDLKRP
jgi:hypothetical protein